MTSTSRRAVRLLLLVCVGALAALGAGSRQAAAWVPNGNFAIAQFNSDGSPDSNFGAGGQVTTDFPSFNYETGNALVLQPDGKLVVVGSVSTYTTGDVFALARYNPDGSLDSGFGSGGLVATPFSVYTLGGARAVALQPDGKLVVAGTLYPGQREFGVARYDADGSLDTSFASGGLATVPFYYWESEDARAIVVQPDGKIVVGGRGALARLDTDGTLDPTFGSGGIAHLTALVPGTAFALALQPDGKIVVAGTDGGGFDFAIARVNSDGSPDTSFSGDGVATMGFMPTAAYVSAQAVIIQPDGKIVVAGSASGYQQYFALARFDQDGTLDTGFGSGGGILTTFPSTIGQVAYALALQADGRIVVAGKAYLDPGTTVFALARYLTDGALDLTFGTGGRVMADFPASPKDAAAAVALRPDGRIVAAGSLSEVPTPDTTPPIIIAPSDITVEATAPDGTIVSYSALAIDDADPSPNLVCDPASGSTFPLGTTIVTCTATDASGNSAHASFAVTVRDTTPPTITTPSSLVVDATSPAGAIVTYSVTAGDLVDPHPTLTCSPASGSTFPNGDTTVTCTATDFSGNKGSASFNVHVKGAAEQIVDLIATVATLQPQPPPTFVATLEHQLQLTLADVRAAHTESACADLSTFIDMVHLRTPPRPPLTPQQVTLLTNDAKRIRAVIGC